MTAILSRYTVIKGTLYHREAVPLHDMARCRCVRCGRRWFTNTAQQPNKVIYRICPCCIATLPRWTGDQP